MSNLSATPQEILNELGGLKLIGSLMQPKMLPYSGSSLGIRLKRANLKKINHIEIKKIENLFKIDFWAFSKDFMDDNLVASIENVELKDLKATIEAHTNFIFPKGDPTRNLEIANEILAQIGGERSIGMMLGMDKVIPVENGVSVQFKVEAANNINCFEITLDPSDTYTVKFLRVTNTKRNIISEHSMIYCDMLVNLIENELQCTLRMPRFI